MSEMGKPAPRAPGTGEPRLQIALLWGHNRIDVRQAQRGQEVTVGNDPTCLLQVFAPEIGERFPLVRWTGEDAFLSVPSSSMVRRGREGAELDGVDGAELERDEALAGVVRLPLTGDERVLVSFGMVRLLVSWSRDERAASLAPELDPAFARAVAMSAMLSCAAVIAGSQTELDTDAVPDLERVTRWVPTITAKPPARPPKLEVPRLKLEPAPQQKSGGTGSEGARRGGAKKRGRGGLLELLDAGLGSEQIFGGGSPGGLDALDRLRGPSSTSAGDGLVGPRGSGAPGPMRLSGIAIGIGGPGGPGGGDRGPPSLGLRRRGPVEVAPQPEPLAGACERSVIAKVVSRHASEIRYCYGTELSKNPSLEGKLAVEFTIDSAGAVTDARIGESTLASPELDACVLRRVSRWKFPEPKDGGVCVIRYPWVFRVGGH